MIAFYRRYRVRDGDSKYTLIWSADHSGQNAYFATCWLPELECNLASHQCATCPQEMQRSQEARVSDNTQPSAPAPLSPIAARLGIDQERYERRVKYQEELVAYYLGQGWRLASRTDTIVQLIRPKRISRTAAFVLPIVVVGAMAASKGDEMIILDIARPETLTNVTIQTV